MKAIYGLIEKDIIWFRIAGYGLRLSKGEPLFSERNGLRKSINILGWRVMLLKANR